MIFCTPNSFNLMQITFKVTWTFSHLRAVYFSLQFINSAAGSSPRFQSFLPAYESLLINSTAQRQIFWCTKMLYVLCLFNQQILTSLSMHPSSTYPAQGYRTELELMNYDNTISLTVNNKYKHNMHKSKNNGPHSQTVCMQMYLNHVWESFKNICGKWMNRSSLPFFTVEKHLEL